MTQRAPRAAPQPGRGSACWASQRRLLDAGVFRMPIGQSVPMIDARARVTGAEALALIEVEYEPLPAVFDPEQALEPDAPILHDRPPRVGGTFADVILNLQENSNRCNHFKVRKGDLEEGFAESDEIFEHVFRSPPVQHVP